MKISPNRYDWFISLTLTFFVHLLVLLFPALPSGTLLVSYLIDSSGRSVESAAPPVVGSAEKTDHIYGHRTPESAVTGLIASPATQPYSLTNRLQNRQAGGEQPAAAFILPPVHKLFTVDTENQRSLGQKTAAAKLLPPLFSEHTIPERPEKEMWKEVRDTQERYILGDIFKDSMPASYTRSELTAKETIFTDRVKNDILDGILDMNFSTFIITAEYFYLSKALIEKGLQPDFTLEEAFSLYNNRLQMVKKDLPAELDGYALVMILQRYAENKFYPENGSGLFLDSLFHNLNDCEGGTKEILAYLDDLYPALKIGSNRGLLKTTTGDVIGHMQVYIGPGKVSEKILSNENGLTVETTRVSLGSILPYSAGDISPLEDFILRYYPSLIEGTPLAERLLGAYDSGGGESGQGEIVGTSDHPLKMSYGVSAALLTDQYYDLSNIRTQKIKNEFSESRFPICDPQIDPLDIDYTNVFSNFVAIDRKMRKNFIGHYLSSLQYWNNAIMPQWKEPPFIATYDDFAGTLIKEKMAPDGVIRIDAENTVLLRSVESHRGLLNYITSLSEKVHPDTEYFGSGSQECKERVTVTDNLLDFLFQSPQGSGVFFLPEPDGNFSWDLFADAVLNDCLVVAGGKGADNLLDELEAEAARQDLSFRKTLYNRIISRNHDTFGEDNRLKKRTAGLELFFTGLGIKEDIDGEFLRRHSGASSADEASVMETVAEQGKTGMYSGLLVDVYDFLGADRLMELVLAYAKRADLNLSLARANLMMQDVVMLLSDGQERKREIAGFLADIAESGATEPLQYSAVYAHAQYVGLSPTETSSALLTALERGENFNSSTLIALLNYGLLKADAVSFYRLRVNEIVSRFPSLDSNTQDSFSSTQFIDLVELIRTASYFNDSRMQETIGRALNLSLIDDFRKGSHADSGLRENSDYGIVLNKLYCLALLAAEKGREKFTFYDPLFLQEYIRFAGKNPIGKIMIALVERLYSADFLVNAVSEIKRKQQESIREIGAELSGIAASLKAGESGRPNKQSGERRERLKEIAGDANVIAYMLFQMDAPSVGKIADDPSAFNAENEKAKVFWYLDNLHRQIGRLDFSGLAGQTRADDEQHGPGTDANTASVASFDVNFYEDDRVRESLSLLAYFSPQKSVNREVKFRKIKDIKSLKDLMNIKITESSRKVTRQDMSLLTLSLNTGNKPQQIGQAWEDTLGVLQKHLNMEITEDQKEYLFAPHYPYLTVNNSGFIYSPEKVVDIHNADKWGGRNDILLSSYLHFKNLTDRLPDWLLRAAIARSTAEREMINRLEQQSFLPMILECESDREELPAPLFKAKWQIRKPYGEDIFPATLLLLRLGYLDISPSGEFVEPRKNDSEPSPY